MIPTRSHVKEENALCSHCINSRCRNSLIVSGVLHATLYFHIQSVKLKSEPDTRQVKWSQHCFPTVSLIAACRLHCIVWYYLKRTVQSNLLSVTDAWSTLWHLFILIVSVLYSVVKMIFSAKTYRRKKSWGGNRNIGLRFPGVSATCISTVHTVLNKFRTAGSLLDKKLQQTCDFFPGMSWVILYRD